MTSHNAKLVQKHSDAEYSRRYARMMEEYESSEDLPPAKEAETLEHIRCVCQRCEGIGRIRVSGYS